MRKLKPKPGTLRLKTIRLLQTTDKTALSIYDATGIKPDWLRSFKAGKLKSPNVDTVQSLYEHLVGKPLEF